MLKSYFFLAFNNLRRRKLRAWLTILGIFIGIAAVVSLISLGQGLQDYISSQFQQLGGDKIIIQSKTFGPPGSAPSELSLTKEDLKAIRNAKKIEDAEGILAKSAVVKFNRESKVVFVLGISQKYLDLFGDIDALKTIEGRQLKSGDKSKAVLGNNHIFGDLWNKKLELGKNIEILGEKFQTVGVLKKQGNPFDDNAVWIDKDVMRNIFNLGDEESQIIAKTKSGENPDEAAEEIKKALRKERDEKVGEETFQVQTSSQLLSTFSSIFAVVQAILVGIAAISLLVGGIGIANTMYTSVLERTREIGTMKAIGARNSDIFKIFLIESGLLGLVGGAIGILLGVGIGKGVEYIATLYLGSPLIQASFSLQLILGALLFSFLVGSFSGLLPAIQASRLNPVDALRYE